MESAIPAHLRTERTRDRRIDDNYRPPAPAFAARFPESVKTVVCAYLGVQSRDVLSSEAAAASAEMLARCTAEDGPDSVEQASFTDEAGYANRVVIAYWSDPVVFERWFAHHHDALIAAGATPSAHGRWIEVVAPTMDRYETIFSSTTLPEGAARTAPAFSEEMQEHGYWGSMRERIPLSQTDPLKSSGAPGLQAHGESGSGIFRVIPHHNVAVIRSGQDWLECTPEETAGFFAEVEPTLREGMDFLSQRGLDVGCLSNRYMLNLKEDWSQDKRSFGYSYWTSLADLERWSESHPTHVEIFAAAMRFLTRGGSALRLYHEVYVASKDQQFYEYHGCHARTGLLNAVREQSDQLRPVALS